MSELVKALLTDRARFISPVVYTAESELKTSAVALAGPFSVTSQIRQDTFFLLQKFGTAISEDSQITHVYRTRGPNRAFGNVILKNPADQSEYLTVAQPNVNFPGLINNTADLPDYILIPGGQYVAVEFNVIDTAVENAYYAAFFTGTEYIMRQGEDMTAIQELAAHYMPPDYTPGSVVQREATPTLADVPAIDRAIALLLGRRELAMRSFAQCECNYRVAGCNYGQQNAITKQWLTLTQKYATETTNIDSTIASLRAKKQSAQAVN